MYVYCKSIRCCCVFRWIHLRIQRPRQSIRLRIDLDHVLACWDHVRVLALRNVDGVLVTRLPVVMQSPQTSSTRCNTHCNIIIINALQRIATPSPKVSSTHCNTQCNTTTQSPKPSSKRHHQVLRVRCSVCCDMCCSVCCRV